MARYAKGRKSVAISDRSGFKVPYRQLKTEWNNLRVEPEEYEPKQPQLDPPKNIVDAQALYQPRPDNDPDDITLFLAFNWFNTSITNDMRASSYDKPNVGAGGTANVGNVSIAFGQDVTGVTGVAGVGRIGNPEAGAGTPTASIIESGVAGTGAVGTETPTASITETGLAGTGAVGTETPTASITETGLAGTGAVGTESIDVNDPYWGHGQWGKGAWGQ